MGTRFACLVALLALAQSLLADAVYPFERYQVILDRKPFGDVPPPPAPPPVPFNPAESFAKTLRMTALVDDDGVMKVGFFDTSNNNVFMLAVGDVESGFELISADYAAEKAVLKKGEELAEVQLGTGAINPIDPNAGQQHYQQRDAQMAQQQMSYAERRRQRQEQRQKEIEAQKNIQPRYTGDELQQHLEEYQMEVIRSGLPPLPIPLTEEMDAQLVEEGVLPPPE